MIRLRVKVKPGARVPSFEEQSDGTWIARVKAPPIEGRANEELVATIAEHFGVRRAQVSIRAGAHGKIKLVDVDR